MLKELSLHAKKELIKGYNEVCEGRAFPEEWTETLVVPVLKPGKDKSCLTSYRPISLTSCVCKLFEKMVNNRLIYTLEGKQVIPEQQMDSEKPDPHQTLTSYSNPIFKRPSRTNNILYS
jgi:hypothetical protein